jgi:hypothetical protein
MFETSLKILFFALYKRKEIEYKEPMARIRQAKA